MREQLRRAFDAMTEAPHPALRSALRARLEAEPGESPPRFWRLTVAVALASGLVGLAFVASLGLAPRGGTLPAPAAATTPTATAEPTAIPTTAPSLAPAVASPPPTTCATFSGGATSMSNVTDVRVGTAAAYDRFVIQFDGPVPAYVVTPQGSSAFVQDATGQTLQLRGSGGVKVVVHGASGTDLNGRQTYRGPLVFTPGSPALQEARQLGDFERVFSWGLGLSYNWSVGLSQPGCPRVTTLTGPDRLVVDVPKP